MDYNLNNYDDIIKFIKNSKKSTPIRAYINGNINNIDDKNIEWYGSDNFYILFGESEYISNFIINNKDNINHYRIETDRKNSAIPLLDILPIDARIEPGAIIRDGVKIGKKAIIMMGAIINIGVEVGDYTMIDMNAVIGARGKIGNKVHIGAGAVIAGVLEPPSENPCIIEDNVLIGANAVILEGVTVGEGSVVAAGSIVTKNVPKGVVVAGIPAKIIKNVDDKTKIKTKFMDDLR
jgi:2,3,4,5-tetrahydropyridine-2-carboxylate N-succinyltransferase